MPSNLLKPVIFSRFQPIFAPRSHAPFLRFTCCSALLSVAFLYFSKFMSFAASLLPVSPCLRLFLAPHPFPLLSRIFAELSRTPVAALTHNPLVWRLVAVFVIIPNRCLIMLRHPTLPSPFVHNPLPISSPAPRRISADGGKKQSN